MDDFDIIITPAATRDLSSQRAYIIERSPTNAGRVLTDLLDAIGSLGEMPARFTVVGRSRSLDSPIHRLVVRPFLIYYRVDVPKREVVVFAVRHGAQRQPSRFR